MNELIKTFKQKDGTVAVDGRDLHDFLGVNEKYTQWFERMKNYGFNESIDFVGFSEKTDKPQGGRPAVNHAMTLDMAKEVSMIQRTQKGKQARQYFIAMEKRAQSKTSLLSPELQFMQGVVDKLAANERTQQRLETKIDGVSEIVATSTMDWRNETSHLISKIARQQGNTGESYKMTRNDIYDEVDRRGGVSLKTRLTNLRRRMAEEGTSKTQRKNTTKVDVIAHDKKLIEIYTAIVKEFAIRYQVWNEEY
ncbi:phage antirepressor Ant [Levilactobacillus brevis]|uniref:antA/AntB antirepressor family protein n=1 Tax=Levilactobacillus brevis TaxID=1580 RepID=UPI000403BD26|nr:antA/AntB antirepressor family protein [Levilactobacillus brevis]ATU68947.1 phage antirepressor Ant [Levilactobacillus brevis]